VSEELYFIVCAEANPALPFTCMLFLCPMHCEQDESSSALDSRSEQDILLSLRRLLESDDNNLSAVLFITHKKTVMNSCDRSIILSEGRIVDNPEIRLPPEKLTKD
jgi:ABC-type dipeptide/oligopeptide/nickel transport system ATPase component